MILYQPDFFEVTTAGIVPSGEGMDWDRDGNLPASISAILPREGSVKIARVEGFSAEPFWNRTMPIPLGTLALTGAAAVAGDATRETVIQSAKSFSMSRV
jgi:hypothetical protein